MKKLLSVYAIVVFVLTANAASANNIASSTMHFEGALTDAGGGVYTGTIDMTEGEYYVVGGPGEGVSTGGGFDVYAKEGGCAYVGGYYGTGAWNCSGNDTYLLGSDHDAYPYGGPWGSWYDPDCADWDVYSLELTADHWYLRYTPTGESPMSGTMDWSNMYAAETDLGTQDGSEPGGSAAHGGGAQAWDWDCGWGVEVIPLEVAGIKVDVQDLGGGQYHVTLTPTIPTTVWVDDDYCDVCANDGHLWGYDAFDNIKEAVDAIGAIDSAMQSGGDRLANLQNNDGGWDWPLDDGNPASSSPTNTVGPIAMGLAQAYLHTKDPDHLTALQQAGAFLLAKTNNFSPSDGYLAAMLDQVFCVTTYTSHVTTYFYDELAAGTYDRNGAGTLYSTASYVQLIRDSRSGASANLAAWDIGMGLVGAASAGASTTEWIAGVKAEIDELDGAGWYDVIGLAGAVYGLAYVGEDFDPTAGEHAAAGSLSDLAGILAGYQIDGGGFTWSSLYLNPGEGNETIQETAYAILALNEFDRNGYLIEIQGAADYMRSVQLATGGWENYTGNGENNEVTGEALWGHTIVYPATATINIAPGTYIESAQIVIDNDLTLNGDSSDRPVIKAGFDTGSSGDPRGWFLVQPDFELHADDLIFDGNGHLVYQAFRHRGSGSFTNCVFRDIKFNESGPTYSGVAIAAFGGTCNPVDVTGCVFEEIGRVGILYFGSGVSGSTYDNNTYTGKGDGDWLDYALDISNGAIVTVQNSTITNCTGVASSDGSTSAGVLVSTLYGPGTEAYLYNNTITGNTTGIAAGYGSSDTSLSVAHYNDLSGNVTEAIDNPSATERVDASGNWWGISTPAGVAGEVSGDVDYTPWLDDGTDQSGDPGFQPDLSYLHVDDDSPQTGLMGRINEAIGLVTSSTINVAAGTYDENVVIAKSLSLIGASSATTIINGNNIENTVTITASDVTISGFKVTGGWSNGGKDVFYPHGGVVVEGNGGASALTGITIEENIIEGNYGNGVYVSAAGHGGTASNVVIKDCQINNNGEANNAGISLTYPNYNVRPVGEWDEWRRPKNILVQGNTIYSNSNYGVYVSAGQDNIIKLNFIWDNSKYGLQLASSWNRTDIPCEYTAVEYNEIHDNQRNGVKLTSYNQYNTFTGNEIYNNGTGGTSDHYKYGFLFQDGNNNSIQNNTISGNALGGLYLWGKGDPSYTWYSTTDNTITGNTISDHTAAGGHGIFIPAQYGNPNSGFLNSHINYNTITNNLAYGLENADATQIVDAKFNYWGDASGPYDPGGANETNGTICYDPATMKNADGAGDEVSDLNVDYCPWLDTAFPDADFDGVLDGLDNCLDTPNGPFFGTCISGDIGEPCIAHSHCGTGGVCSTGQEDNDQDGLGDACDDDIDGDGSLNDEDICPLAYDPGQEDNYPPGGNGCGDACECEGDFESDGDLDGTDAFSFKENYGRWDCTEQDPCNGDFICDGDVDGSDAYMFKVDFGRRDCPSCPFSCY